MRRILFEPATPEDFLAALRPIWQEHATWLTGEDDFATALAAAALAEGLDANRGTPPPDAPGCPLIILTETRGAALQAELLRFAELENVTLLAPVTDWHFSQRPLFLISIPKSGTHLIYELARALGYHAGGEPPEFPNGQTWYHLEYQNSHTAAADFFVDTVRRAPFGNRHHRFMSSPAIFIYRHPLDILVSEAYYDHLDGKTPFAGWFDGLDFEARAGRLLHDNFLLGSLRERTAKFLPWLDFPNVIGFSFEELVGSAGGGSDREQHDLIWSLLLKLQIPGDPAEFAAKVFNTGSATFRAGQIGAYRRELPAAWISRFAKTNTDLLAAFGYAANSHGLLPETRLARRRRPLSTSPSDFDSVPITLESGYLGCNLVRYKRRIYAVPVAAGAIALEALPAERLAALPSSTDLSELKALLLIGSEELARRQRIFLRLSAMLQGDAAPDGAYADWADAEAPALIEAYHDYNIVCFKRRFYGIRQSLGAVDFNRDPDALLDDYGIDEFIVASTAAQLRDEIDGLSASRRLRREMRALHTGVAARAEVLAQRLEAQGAALNTALAKARRALENRLAGATQAQAAESAAIAERLGVHRAELNTALAELRKLEGAAAQQAAQAATRLSGFDAELDGVRRVLAAGLAEAEAARAALASGMETRGAALGAALEAARQGLRRQLDDCDADWTARWEGQNAGMAAMRGALDQAEAVSAAMRVQLSALEAGISELNHTLAREAAAWSLAREQAGRVEGELAALRAALERGLAAAAARMEAQAQRQLAATEALRHEVTQGFDAALCALRQQLEQQVAENQKQSEQIAELRLNWPFRLARWRRGRG